MAKYPCPLCGYLTLDETLGCYEICPVCGWEDDPVQVLHPLLRGGANKGSMWEKQQAWLRRTGLNPAFERDPSWRPLRPDDLSTGSMPQTGLEYFHAVPTVEITEAQYYYWLRTEPKPS